MRRIFDFIRAHWDVVSYLFFGALTTLVNYVVYFPLYNWMHFSATLSNILAWAVAVIFAYLTNKPFVFHSNDWSWETVSKECLKFVGCRIGSGALETIIVCVFVDILMYNGNWTKIIVSVLVVILNYISSKWFVFRK